MKEVNKSLANEFHIWQRKNLPSKFIIQDIDTWSLVISDSEKNFDPLCLVELKRSSFEPKDWFPFKADLPNYLALFKFSLRAKIPLAVIYFKKGKSLSDSDSKLAVFKVTDVNNSNSKWITYSKIVISGNDFIEKFPSILT